MRLLRTVRDAPARPTTPAIPTTVCSTRSGLPMLSRITQSWMETLLRFTTTAASVALGSRSRSPPVTVTRSRRQDTQSSNRMP